MNKLIKLLALGTVLPLSLNSLNLVSVSYSSDNSLSAGAKVDKQAKEIENTATAYCESLNANLENLYKTGGTMGCLYNGGNLTKASELAAELLPGGNTSAEGSFNTGDKATVAILIDVVSKGLRWDFSNGVDDMIGALKKYIEAKGDEKKLSSSKEYEEYCKGRNYLATAVFQEMLIKLCRTSSALFDEDDFIECCRIVENYLNVQVNDENANYLMVWDWDKCSSNDRSTNLREMVRDTITATIGGFYSMKNDLGFAIAEDNRLNIDLSKRIKYKKYFRDCTYQGIKKYFTENKSVNAIKGATLAEIEKWKQNEENMYDLINELKEKRRKNSQNFDKCVGDVVSKISDALLNAVRKKTYDSGCPVITITKDEMACLKPLINERILYVEKFGNDLGKLQAIIDYEKGTEMNPEVDNWVNNPLIRGSKTYLSIIDQINGSDGADIFNNIKGLYVLNEFTFCNKSVFDPKLGQCELENADEGLKRFFLQLGLDKYNMNILNSSNSDHEKINEQVDWRLAASLLTDSKFSVVGLSCDQKDIWKMKGKRLTPFSTIDGRLPVPYEIYDDDFFTEDDRKITLNSLENKLNSMRVDLIGYIDEKDEQNFDKLIKKYAFLASIYSYCIRNRILRGPKGDNEPFEKEVLGKIKMLSWFDTQLSDNADASNGTVGDIIDIIKQRAMVLKCFDKVGTEGLYDYSLNTYLSDDDSSKNRTVNDKYEYDLPAGYGKYKLPLLETMAIRTLLPFVFALNGNGLSLIKMWRECDYYSGGWLFRCLKWCNPSLTKKLLDGVDNKTGASLKRDLFEKLKSPGPTTVRLQSNIKNVLALTDMSVFYNSEKTSLAPAFIVKSDDGCDDELLCCN